LKRNILEDKKRDKCGDKMRYDEYIEFQAHEICKKQYWKSRIGKKV
jgi:hypothetical protein